MRLAKEELLAVLIKKGVSESIIDRAASELSDIYRFEFIKKYNFDSFEEVEIACLYKTTGHLESVYCFSLYYQNKLVDVDKFSSFMFQDVCEHFKFKSKIELW